MSGSVASTSGVLHVADRASAIDLAEPSARVASADIAEALCEVASELRSLWSSAVERGDFDEITRLVEASHAVHRAVIALTTDRFIAASSASGCGGDR
jgi:hypothetical protein